MLFFIVLAIFTILVGGLLCWYNNREFWTGNLVGPVGLSYCQNCGYLDAFKCGTCSNCGYCISPDNVGECVPGDVTGPYFRRDCVGWNYGMRYVQPTTYVPTPWYYNIWPWSWNVPKHAKHVRNDVKDKKPRRKKK